MRSISFFFTGVLFIILLCYSLYTYTEINSMKVSESLSPVKTEAIIEDKSVIRNLESHRKIHTNEDKIFFVESQNSVHHKLSGRQACSIESAALMNANATIFVIFLTPKDHVELEHTNLTDILLQIKNVYFVYLNIKYFSKDTPLEDWIKTDELSNSKYVVSHTSDVLRYLLLYKYSGLYLDMDVITTYPSAHINLTNFACAESYKWINGAVLKLTGNSGRKMAENLMLEVKKNFDGEIWGRNGPELLSRTIKELCDVSNFYSTTKCKNFTILERDKCYAISWEEWEMLFQSRDFNIARKRTRNSYFIHLWNHFSASRNSYKSSNNALNRIAEEFCPKVYESLDIYF
ncbi:hypothetical protein ACKWTF_000975 [Chironomus riparius]